MTKTDGKVFFDAEKCRSAIEEVWSLRSVERVFIQVLHMKTKDIMEGRQSMVNQLEKFLLRKNLWQECLSVYQLTTPRNVAESPAEQTEEKNRQTENTTLTLMERSKILAEKSSETHTTSTTKHKMADTDPPLKAKQIKLDATAQDSDFSFRISCKCSGVISRKIQPRDLSRRLGYKLSQMMSWRTDLRHPSMEICIHLNDDSVVVGIPISQTPLSKRAYIRHCGLRSPVAWIMCKLANIQPGDRVLDPLCGKATILIEGANYWKEAWYTGVDVDVNQLKCASDNIIYANLGTISLLHADVNSLPLRAKEFDVIICDLPFGQKHGEKSEMEKLYPHIMANMNRVLSAGGRVVLLTSVSLEKVILKYVKSPKDETDKVVVRGRSTEENDLSDGNHRNRGPEIAKTETLGVVNTKTSGVGTTQICVATMETSGVATMETSGVATMETSGVATTETPGVATTETSSVTPDMDSLSDGVLTVEGLTDKALAHQTIRPHKSNPINSFETDNTSQYQGRLPWQFLESHYIKLGETHSRICVFRKE